MDRNDIVKMGEGAVRYLAKYPFSAVAEKEHHKLAALIGKLAEKGCIDITKPISEEEIRAISEVIEKEVMERRKTGNY